MRKFKVLVISQGKINKIPEYFPQPQTCVRDLVEQIITVFSLTETSFRVLAYKQERWLQQNEILSALPAEEDTIMLVTESQIDKLGDSIELFKAVVRTTMNSDDKKSVSESTVFNISGGQVIAGRRVHAPNATLTQLAEQLEGTVDLEQLADELSKLRQEMKKKAIELEQDIVVSEIAKAEQAARNKNVSQVEKHLASAGKWALEVSQKIGVALAAEALKQAMGLK